MGRVKQEVVGTDSGHLIIVDPGYLGEAFYRELLTHQRSDGSFDTSYLTPNSRGIRLAVVVNVPDGDGTYPVDVSDEAVVVTFR